MTTKSKHHMLRWKILTILLITLVGVFIAHYFDHRTIKLTHIGVAHVSPGLGYYYGDDFYAFMGRRGKDLTQHVETHLALETKYPSKQNREADGDIIKKPAFVWPDELELEKDVYYYVGLACEIEEMSYYWHTKYTNKTGYRNLFELHSTKLVPVKDKGTINIYRADVIAVEILW